MAQFLFPVYARAIGSRATWILWTNPWFWLIMVLIFAFCTACSGNLSRDRLFGLQTRKGVERQFYTKSIGIAIRKGLALIQFSLSVLMIMSIYVISRQLFFLQGKDLGIGIHQVMVIRTNELGATSESRRRLPAVEIKDWKS